MPMTRYDLAVTHDWEYDADFVGLIAAAARARGLSTLLVPPGEAGRVLDDFRSGALDFGLLVDRASGASPEFVELQALALSRGRDVLEGLDKLRWASDKATMHLEFLSAGIPAPYTLILPSYAARPHLALTPRDLAPLGAPFVIKPANTTGGSLGVVVGATGPAEVLAARRTFPADKYLLQERITPDDRNGRRFWFRGFYVLGQVHLAWWDDRTHLYAELGYDEAAAAGLEPVYALVRSIARVSRLRFFSTEAARDVRGRLVVVDYVNEICDMRLRSAHADGVPDAIVGRIADRIAAHAAEAAARRTAAGGEGEA
ncbi:MAG TPA: hypothetical protein P5119_12220 [Candidatus Aminicenantes bacterium]|nr:hypothetical protein [Candidatus Aminicenantes bacterium]HRY66090.1 hypothetical protein [Candidatus Aminicenantes bacterium]HRZ72861.1 hypothetical protein [Candidatus Aminicenantes bacterium]